MVVLVRPPPVPVTVTGNVPNEAEELTIKVLVLEQVGEQEGIGSVFTPEGFDSDEYSCSKLTD